MVAAMRRFWVHGTHLEAEAREADGGQHASSTRPKPKTMIQSCFG
jgi:hypothetical protein